MKLNVRTLVRTALLLALCVASQFIKNTSVFITGSIVNAILIVTVLSCGLLSGTIISVLSPLTSWFITGSPLMSAVPLLLPCIMLGNLILVIFVWFFAQRLHCRFPKVWLTIAGGILGSVVKAGVMWALIVKVVLAAHFGTLGKAVPDAVAAQFSITQLITALIGTVLAVLIWLPLSKVLKNNTKAIDS